MTALKQRVALCFVAAASVAGALTLVVERVRAAGAPTVNALTYSGYLEAADGTVVNDAKNIGLEVYDHATAGKKVCEVPSDSVMVSGGRFQIPLGDDCTDAVKANPDLWVQVDVEGGSLGRAKLGAVPYAVEAGHALDADSASTAVDEPTVTAWQPYDATLHTSLSSTALSNQTTTGSWRRVGDTVELDVSTSLTAAPDALSSGDFWVWSLPKIGGVELAWAETHGTGLGIAWVYTHTGTSVACHTTMRSTGLAGNCAGSSAFLPSAAGADLDAGDSIALHVSVPVQGWDVH